MNQPNILLVIADGMQAEVLDQGHACRTPALDALAARGVSFSRAHTTSPTCSPARASLLTGLLPHNHGVLEIEHARDADQCVLRDQYPHFAQRLVEAGYQTGYFGKWHVERSHELSKYGWQQSLLKDASHVNKMGRGDRGPAGVSIDPSLRGYVEGPAGYNRLLHWGVTDTPIDQRYPGITVTDAERFIEQQQPLGTPWCCCVSFSEPNESLIVGRETWETYDPMAIPLPDNFFDDMSERPNIYRREQAIGRQLNEANWRAARACYFGRITEVDRMVARLTSKLESTGCLDQTVVIFLSDHGRYVGAHGFDAHNFGGFEEIYRIPLIFAGPRIAVGKKCHAHVSIADVADSICDIAGARRIGAADSQSVSPLLLEPETISPSRQQGFAEYHGTRFPLMQRVLWEWPWKFVFNGFDFDELYRLDEDPAEKRNLAGDPQYRTRVERMMRAVWDHVRRTGDRAILESHYFSLRLACVGPNG